MSNIHYKSKEEIAAMEEGGKRLGEVLFKLMQSVEVGMETRQIDALAEKLIESQGGKPSFKGYMGFPATVCICINDEVVHGIPSSYKLKNGDILSMDIGFEHKGLHTDTAVTVPVGDISNEAKDLIEITKTALDRAIEAAKPGNTLGDIGHAVQSLVEPKYGIVRSLVGHGIGKTVHEDPQVPNYGQPGTGMEIKPGLVIAIEPMVTIGSHQVETADDNWTILTKDASLAAHFEHTIAITESGPKILTKRPK